MSRTEQNIESDLWSEFEEELKKVKEFDISKLELTEQDNGNLSMFFKKYLDPKENFPAGSRHNIIEKNLAIWIVSNGIQPGSAELQSIKDAYASNGYKISSLSSQLKGVEKMTYGSEPKVNVGELVNWCKENRPDLVPGFTTEYVKPENPYNKLHYSTEHLPKYHEFSSTIGLYGREYIPLIKARWYQLMGGILQKKITLGRVKTDTRVHVAYPIPTEAGKNELIYSIKKLIDHPDGLAKGREGFFKMSEPISYSPESLIGKMVERLVDNPDPTKKRKLKLNIENKGHFDNDFLEFDECTSLIVSEAPDIKQAREYISKSENPMGENFVEKRLVDDLPTETIKYAPGCTNTYYFQPTGMIPEVAILQGFMRRKLIPIGNIELFLNHANNDNVGRKLRETSVNVEEYRELIRKHLADIRQFTSNQDFAFTDGAIKLIEEFTLYLSTQARIHSEKISNYARITKYTTLNNLVKFSCIIAGAHRKVNVCENCVSLAFMDLTEILQSTYDYIKVKTKGNFTYKDYYGEAEGKEKEALKHLYSKEAFTKENSKVTISSFDGVLKTIFAVGDDQARNHRKKMEKKNLISFCQVGKTSSAVWLNNIKPEEHKDYAEGLKGCKGWTIYNNIFLTNKQLRGAINPFQPFQP